MCSVWLISVVYRSVCSDIHHSISWHWLEMGCNLFCPGFRCDTVWPVAGVDGINDDMMCEAWRLFTDVDDGMKYAQWNAAGVDSIIWSRPQAKTKLTWKLRKCANACISKLRVISSLLFEVCLFFPFCPPPSPPLPPASLSPTHISDIRLTLQL